MKNKSQYISLSGGIMMFNIFRFVITPCSNKLTASISKKTKCTLRRLYTILRDEVSLYTNGLYDNEDIEHSFRDFKLLITTNECNNQSPHIDWDDVVVCSFFVSRHKYIKLTQYFDGPVYGNIWSPEARDIMKEYFSLPFTDHDPKIMLTACSGTALISRGNMWHFGTGEHYCMHPRFGFFMPAVHRKYPTFDTDEQTFEWNYTSWFSKFGSKNTADHIYSASDVYNCFSKYATSEVFMKHAHGTNWNDLRDQYVQLHQQFGSDSKLSVRRTKKCSCKIDRVLCSC